MGVQGNQNHIFVHWIVDLAQIIHLTFNTWEIITETKLIKKKELILFFSGVGLLTIDMEVSVAGEKKGDFSLKNIGAITNTSEHFFCCCKASTNNRTFQYNRKKKEG